MIESKHSAPKFSLKVFGSSIYEARHRLGLTQKELAVLLDKSEKTIQKLEAGESDAPISSVFKISEHLAIPVSQLLNLPDSVSVHNFNNNQQDGHVNILNSGVMSAEREMYELRLSEHKERINDMKEHILSLERTITMLQK
jgi:transcriptional regulator with XRE-family HTH domain